jgi:hypothetical protein
VSQRLLIFSEECKAQWRNKCVITEGHYKRSQK